MDKTDITREAQMILSCVRRIQDKLGYNVGMTILTDTLHGAVGGRVEALQLYELSTYGLLRNVSNGEIRSMIEALKAQGYLRLNDYSALVLDESARAVLFSGKRVVMQRKGEAKGPDHFHSKPATELPDASLFEWLRTVRTQLAEAEGVPPYIIFGNDALNEMAAKRPHTMEELLAIDGVGETKAQRYGQRFLDKIRDYEKAAGKEK